MKKIQMVLLWLCIVVSLSAQVTDQKLHKLIAPVLQSFKGDAGIYIKNLRTGKAVAINADTLFPTASIVKIPILLGIMQQIRTGQLQYHQALQYKDSLLYAGSDILGSFKHNEKIELSKVIMLMLTTSDNTASLWLQSLAGGGTRINQLLDSLGYSHTRVNSRTPGREGNRAQFGWGQTTPAEMGALMERLYAGKLLSDSADKAMVRLLGRNYWDEQALSAIPPTVFVASKNGAVDASRSEVLLVMCPGNPYIFSLFTKNISDKSWGDNNEAWQMTIRLSQMVWAYFNKK
jgi:beta-lactamase class A